MIDARDFLEAVAGYSDTPVSGPKSSNERPVKIGTIDPYYTSGPARVLFDGESIIGKRGYSWVSSYTPVNGDRVFLIPVGQSYVIGGALSSSVPYSRYVPLPMSNGWGNFSDPSFHTPSFTKTETGLVKLTGMASGGASSQYTTMATLPVGFRPDKEMIFPVLCSGNVTGSVRITPTGLVRIDGYASPTWVSLGNIVFPTEKLTWNDVTLLNSFTAPADSIIGQAQYAKDSYGRIWFRGGVGRASAPAADTPMFNVPAGYRPQYQTHLPASSSGTLVRNTALIDVTATGDVRYKAETMSMTTISLNGVMFDEVSNGGWTNATLQNSWVNNDAATQGPARYRKDSDGTVHISGLVRTGTINTAIFTLPAGYRPAKTIIRYTQAFNTQARIEIRADGQFVAQAGSNTWFSIDGVSFTAEA